ncbi:MAG: carbamoyl transferase, partial [Candidatus Thermoplasmatota archaeon]|nr:carbamoyl transferase [Candidatus Thermoplasmatota archaeon]
AFKVYSDLKNETKYWDWKESCDNVYLGPKFSSSQIEKVLVEKDDIDFEIIDDKSEIISSLLASGKIVGLFQGRMEYGPRALGNRSIIANPSKMETREKLNKMLGREPFQPFSPTILRKHADDYLEDTTPNKFMTMSFDVTEKAKEQIKAATHIDGTCRPQILERKDNPPFYDIIKCFEKKTDIAAVLNTSFNLHGEPIVCTPKQAVDAFKKIGLDALACGEFLVTKTK